jgi:hypothetical protein
MAPGPAFAAVALDAGLGTVLLAVCWDRRGSRFVSYNEVHN